MFLGSMGIIVTGGKKKMNKTSSHIQQWVELHTDY